MRDRPKGKRAKITTTSTTTKDRRFISEYGEDHPANHFTSTERENSLLVRIQNQQRSIDRGVKQPTPKAPSTDPSPAETFKRLFSAPLAPASNVPTETPKLDDPRPNVLFERLDQTIPLGSESFDAVRSGEFYAGALSEWIKSPESFSFSTKKVLGMHELATRSNIRLEVNEKNPVASIVNSFSSLLLCSPEVHSRRLSVRNQLAQHILGYLYRPKEARTPGEPSDPPIQDAGFTRPSVLILAPMRSAAFDIIQLLIRHSNTGVHSNYKRFVAEYSSGSEPNGHDIFYGNLDDCFQVGISFNSKRTRTKLFADFYDSDVIVASPLALRQTLENDSDFLSSVQILVIDSADVIAMQNWDHLEYCVASLNKIPQQTRDCDFARLGPVYSDGNARFVTQTIVTSSIQTPLINSIFNRQSSVLAKSIIKPHFVSLAQSAVVATTDYRLDFCTFSAASLETANDDRFGFFVDSVFRPFHQECSFEESRRGHVLIFVSSYFDYLRLKTWFERQDIDFESLTEYTSAPNVTRVRGWFFNGQTRFLIVTERFLFYKGYRIRGIRCLLWYSLPEFPSLYPLLMDSVGDCPPGAGESCKVSVVCSKLDALRMERIYGTGKMLSILAGISAPDTSPR